MIGRKLGCRIASAVALALAAGPLEAAPAPLVETSPAATSSNVTREQLENLPVGRRLEDLIRSCPSNTIPTVSSQPGQPQYPVDAKPGIDLNCIQPPDIEMVEVYKAHNIARADYGAPPLAWDPFLAQGARAYASQLSQTGRLAHAPRAGRGTVRENISQGLPGWNARRLTGSWLNERAYFRPGVFPNVSSTGDWYQVGHFSQMIWPQTTLIGCARGLGAGSSWLVCRYDPGGNKDGRPVGIPVQARPVAPAPNKWIRPRLIGGDYSGKAQQAAKPDRPNSIRYRWIDVKTGKPVPTVIVMPGKGEINFGQSENYHLVIPGAGDPNRAYDPVTKRNFARENGAWIDTKTGKPVPTVIVMPGKGEISFGASENHHLVTPGPGDPSRAYDPVTGRNFAKVPVTPPK